MLQPGPADDQRRLVGFNELYQGARNFGTPVANFLEGFAKLKDEARVNRILAGRTVVNECRSLLVILGNERSELLSHWNGDGAGKRALSCQVFNRKQVRIALRLNRCGG